MKKILASIMIVFLLVTCVCVAGAAEKDFKVDITGDSIVTKGETVTYEVSVKSISVSNGLNSATITVNYDTNFFDASSVEVADPSITNWNVSHIKSEGSVELSAYADMTKTYENVKNDGIIKFKITLKVRADAVEGSEKAIYVNPDINLTNGGYTDSNGVEYYENIDCAALDVKLQKQLPVPTGLSLADGTAKWDAVDNASSYILQLYKNGTKLGSETAVNATTYDFSSLITSGMGGAYTFTVKAESSSEAYTASNVSDPSDPYNYRGKLSSPKITVEVDKITGKVSYVITDSNPDEAVGSYIISIYKKGESEPLYEITGITEAGKGEIDKTLEGGKEYDFTVTAISSDNNPDTGNASSDESARATAKADSVTGITLGGSPLLSYIEGDTLNLSALVVTVKYASGEEVPVSLKDFEKYGITVSPKHGADLTLSMNGRKITVTLGSLTANEELVLVVESGECKHDGETEDEHKDATCGEDGYDKKVCKLCGVAVESEVIPATGNHQFSDWTWLFEPTQSIDGIRTHKCQICGKEENENVTYEDYLASQTTPGTSDTDPVITTPEQTEQTTEGQVNDPLGGLGNIGKIFLIALVVIFAIIVLFIVIAIWSESRGNRRRRSNRRAGSSGKRPPQNRGNNPQNRPRR